MPLTVDEIDALVSEVNQLPDLMVSLRINRMLQNPDVSAQALSQVIMLDSSLTVRLLRLCNSPVYGFSRKIATVRDAVTILGFKTLRQMLFTVISQNVYSRSFDGYALGKNELWENAFTCATYAQHLARRFRFSDPDIAFTASMLRDIGKLVMEKQLSGKQDEINRLLQIGQLSFEQVEEEIIGASHTTLGARLAEKWQLPESLVAAIQYHHTPSRLPSESSEATKKLVSIVHLADVFTMMCGTGTGTDGMCYPLDPKSMVILNIPPENLTLIYSELLDQQTIVESALESLRGGNDR